MNDKPMVPCDHVIAKLWEYLDGSLDALRSDEVHRHLDICARCFPEYDFRRAYLRFMRKCSTEEVAPALRRRLFEMVLDQERRAERAMMTPGPAGLLEKARSTLRRALRRG
ncbi:MAG: zf-HC2 domain-containing protein [Gemmatimonadota bacterium]|nr:zf-HC2 domain-containing protein [Gemmatimonadota bacterium]